MDFCLSLISPRKSKKMGTRRKASSRWVRLAVRITIRSNSEKSHTLILKIMMMKEMNQTKNVKKISMAEKKKKFSMRSKTNKILRLKRCKSI